jgi:5-methyltetrahydrofolate--homocysteine methyltransferase
MSPKENFSFLRQQKEKTNDESAYYCLSDFIAPKNSGVNDYLGMFAVTMGYDVEKLAQKYEAEHDDYTAIMVKALGDRFAEACTEWLHENARLHWAYGKNESLKKEDLIAEKYQGIRPAPGYPACPDHTEKRKIWTLLEAEKNIGASLTENCAINPPSSVSGYYFSHPQARYFMVGKVGLDQIENYAQRKKMSFDEVRRWLSPNIEEHH